MIKSELLEAIRLFEKALAQKKSPVFKNLHRAEQVLRILKVDYATFEENEADRACKPSVRALWENPVK